VDRGRGQGRQTIAAVLTAVVLGSALAAGATASPGGSAQASKTATVDIVNFAFKPATLSVAPGTKVVFANAGSSTHTATRDNGFDTGSIKPGESAGIRFKQKGTFRYHCDIHSFMRGKIVVG
jgi:plastocyanin